MSVFWEVTGSLREVFLTLLAFLKTLGLAPIFESDFFESFESLESFESDFLEPASPDPALPASEDSDFEASFLDSEVFEVPLPSPDFELSLPEPDVDFPSPDLEFPLPSPDPEPPLPSPDPDPEPEPDPDPEPPLPSPDPDPEPEPDPDPEPPLPSPDPDPEPEPDPDPEPPLPSPDPAPPFPPMIPFPSFFGTYSYPAAPPAASIALALAGSIFLSTLLSPGIQGNGIWAGPFPGFKQLNPSSAQPMGHLFRQVLFPCLL
jgi:hypothetical protein